MTGLQLSKMRRAAGLTQRQVAEAIGITRSAIAIFEAGIRPVPASRVQHIESAIHRLAATRRYTERVWKESITEARAAAQVYES